MKRLGSHFARYMHIAAVAVFLLMAAPVTEAAAATVHSASTGSVCAIADCPYQGSSSSLSFATPSGYWLVASDGGVFSYGNASFAGSTGGTKLNQPIVGLTPDPATGGYWLVASDGGVFAFNAPFYGSTGNIKLNQPIVGMVPTPSGAGYWLVAADGGVFAYGDAKFNGSAGGIKLNQPIVSMAATADGNGYWLVARDGGVFAYGDARFNGSAGNIKLNQPIVGMATTADGNGYWLVARDGGIFAYGDASFQGSTGGSKLNQPIVGMAADATTGGYWLVASDGGVFAFNAPFAGSMGGTKLNQPIVGIASAASFGNRGDDISSGTSSARPASEETGSLAVSVNGLPDGTNAGVVATDPNGHTQTLARSSTIDSAMTGTWTVTARPVTVGANTYFPWVTTTTVQLDAHAQGSTSVDFTQVVANTTRVADGDAIHSVTPPDSAGNQTVVVSDPNNTLQIGDVLTAGVTANTPDGLLLDVTGVGSNPDGSKTITGTEGSLTDIGPQADIEVDQSYTDDGSITETSANASTNATPRMTAQGTIKGKYTFNKALTCNGSASSNVNGSVDFAPHIQMNLKWGGLLAPDSITAKAVISGTESASYDVSLSAKGSCALDTPLLPTAIPLGVIDVQIGPVPVIITPRLNFQLQASANGNGQLQSSAGQTLTVSAGLQWDGSNLTPISGVSGTYDSPSLNPLYNGKLHAQVGPNVTFAIYGIAGPYVNADTHIDLKVDGNANPWWVLTGGIKAGGGLKFNVKKIHFNKSNDSILSQDWTIAQAATMVFVPPDLSGLPGGGFIWV